MKLRIVNKEADANDLDVKQARVRFTKRRATAAINPQDIPQSNTNLYIQGVRNPFNTKTSW